jgi:hypothetical protein
MSEKLNTAITVMGIDIGKNSFHVIGLDARGAIALRQKWSRGQVETRLANMPPCLIGMEACVGAHHLSRRVKTLGHDARLMPAKYVRPYSKGQKNDFRDGDAIAEAVQRPTMKFVATKTAEQLDLQALHRVRERLVSQRTGVYNATGYFEKNPFNAYTLNNITAKKDTDGAVTIQFGGCDNKIPNCLPITPGWNYLIRLYRPCPEVLDGKWHFPEAQPTS